MLWGCIAGKGMGTLQEIDGIMRKEDNLQILKQHLQQDHDPKRTTNIVKNKTKKWHKDNKMKVLY